MHDLQIVHGCLKGARIFLDIECLHATNSPTKANILINRDRRACIADFGLTTITGVVTHAPARAPFTPGGTYRWMSPELLDPERFGVPESEGNRPTRQSDCYALGMVIYEVHDHTNELVLANT